MQLTNATVVLLKTSAIAIEIIYVDCRGQIFNCQSIERWLNIHCIYNMEYYEAIKKMQ